MTVDHDKTENPAPAEVQVDVAAPAPMISRRMLLRGASAAVPTILTLQSGAALAASSNLMGTVGSASHAVGDGGKVQCLEFYSVDQQTSTPGQLDLGQSPDLWVQYIEPRTYYKSYNGAAAESQSDIATIEYMCENGGKYYYKDHGPQEALSVSPGEVGQELRRGFLVSSTALSSFTSSINRKTYF